jgi:CDP-4-dehydro-6-deoxyglucose reductase, E1
MFWPLMENVVSERDLEVLINFIKRTKRFTQFEKVKEFEDAFSLWQGCKYSVYVNSGSSANLILLSAAKELYEWEVGSEVIVPAVTWTTTVTPVIQLGLSPVFVDINLDDLAVDYDQVSEAITSKTRAIFVAHLLGFPAAIEKLNQIIENKNIVLLEDCCETQGGIAEGKKVGNHGVGGTFSFYWGHHMTTVEGGMVCTNNEELYKLLLLKRSHGLARELPQKFHAPISNNYPDIDFNFLFLTDGFNVRNTEFNAVLGVEQLGRLDGVIETRNKNYKEFIEECEKWPNRLLILDHPGISSFVLPFFFKKKQDKEAFQKLIRESEIESRPIISGNLLRQPFLANYVVPDKFPNADFIHENAFYVGNNQFVDSNRLSVLFKLMNEYFMSRP